MPQSKVAKKEVGKNPVEKVLRTGASSLVLFTAGGAKSGTIAVDGSVFHSKVNLPLISQAVRIHLSNRRQGTKAAKTRGEVKISGRKIYRQKGTGRARHGARSAPIFVGGGVTFAPKPIDYTLSLSDKMKKQALLSALSAQFESGGLIAISGLSGIEPKTKKVASVLPKLARNGPYLFVLPESWPNALRAIRNIAGCDIRRAKDLSTFDVVSHKTIIFAKESLPILEGRLRRT